MKMNNPLLNLFNIELPVIQGPMAGGNITTPLLVSTVANVGALGSIAAGYLSPDQLAQQIEQVQQQTQAPFAVNLFIPNTPNWQTDVVAAMINKLNPLRSLFHLPPIHEIKLPEDLFNQQIEVILSYDIPICSFTFGVPDAKIIRALKAKKIILIGTATHVKEAQVLADAGCDAIVAQGAEAGGHRGTFIGHYQQGLFKTFDLTQALVRAVAVPIIAAGGLIDSKGLQAALTVGAAGVQMGSVFLTCTESGAAPVYKKAVFAHTGDDTAITTVISGKAARGIRNQFMNQLEADKTIVIPDYPIQHYLTSEIRQAAAKQNNSEYLSLWAGLGIGAITKEESAIDILARIKQAWDAMN